MANLIDKTYFVADIVLAQSDDSDIDDFIAKYEKEVLMMLLGYTLYKLTVIETPIDPYKKILDGDEYEIVYNGNTRLVKYEGVRKMIANYVYCNFMKNRVSSTQEIGEIVMVGENSRRANIFGKLNNAWITFEELYGHIDDNRLIPSAYNYIYEHKQLFPEWEFTELNGSINSHDL